MNEDIGGIARWRNDEGGDQISQNREYRLSALGAESQDSETAHLRDVVDQLEYAVQVCSRESIPLPFVLREVEKALGVDIDDLSADWPAALRLHLVDYVTAVFAKDHLQPPRR
ncbi:hypothetical protein [Nocardia alba]|uniref:Uncharacterized protein n=1 Tax=Nocardia alba TaxID=225051 RepID=A0A4R1G045_9NOCA|nr:hypothetical protein [Nocardia alba]TCJ97001.1 hypothetical protein DFR71_3036 [Nocardia alba]